MCLKVKKYKYSTYLWNELFFECHAVTHIYKDSEHMNRIVRLKWWKIDPSLDHHQVPSQDRIQVSKGFKGSNFSLNSTAPQVHMSGCSCIDCKSPPAGDSQAPRGGARCDKGKHGGQWVNRKREPRKQTEFQIRRRRYIFDEGMYRFIVSRHSVASADLHYCIFPWKNSVILLKNARRTNLLD